MGKTNLIYRVGKGKERFFYAGKDHLQEVFKGKKVHVLQWGAFMGKNRIRIFQGTSRVTEEPGIAPPKMGPGTSLRELFWKAKEIDIPTLPSWDMSNVTDMHGMFAHAGVLYQDISRWNTSNVKNMNGMFWGFSAFNQDIGSWDTGKVTDMGGMFTTASAFNQDIGSWDTGNVEDMRGMFNRAKSFNQDIGSWDTGEVLSLDGMFFEASAFNQDLSSWDTDKAGEDMTWMFYGANKMAEKNKPQGANNEKN